MKTTTSIRKRTLISTLLTLLGVLMVVSVATREVAVHESEEVFSAQLASRARLIDALISQIHPQPLTQTPLIIDIPASLKKSTEDQATPLGHPYEQKIAFQVWTDNGQLLAKSVNAPQTPLANLANLAKSNNKIQYKLGFSQNFGQTDWYVFTIRSTTPQGGWIMVGEQAAIRREVVRELGLSVVMPLFIGTIILLLMINFILLLNLRPLAYLAQEILSRDPESLNPISHHKLPQELIALVKAFNRLMERMNEALVREQNFIDACAHEIRTPIAALQLHVQNALHAKSEDLKNQSLNMVLSSARRTTRLAEQLLIFSRLSGKGDHEVESELALVPFVQEILANYAPLILEKGQNIEFVTPSAGFILGQPYKLERLLINLLDNASQYGKAGGTITVSVTQQSPKKLILSISNEGVPIPPEKRAHIFAPYVRLNSGQGVGSGLGLAIVKNLVQLHRGKISVQTLPDGTGTVMVIEFPAIIPTQTRHP